MATVTWTLGADGNWSTTSNWTPSHIPGTGDVAVLTSATAHTVTHDSGADTISSLLATNDTLTVSGGSLSITKTATFGAGLSETDGVLSFGGNASVAGPFQQTGGILTIASAITLTLSGSASLANASISGPGTLATTGATSVIWTSYLDGSMACVNSGKGNRA